MVIESFEKDISSKEIFPGEIIDELNPHTNVKFWSRGMRMKTPY